MDSDQVLAFTDKKKEAKLFVPCPTAMEEMKKGTRRPLSFKNKLKKIRPQVRHFRRGSRKEPLWQIKSQNISQNQISPFIDMEQK